MISALTLEIKILDKEKGWDGKKMSIFKMKEVIKKEKEDKFEAINKKERS